MNYTKLSKEDAVRFYARLALNTSKYDNIPEVCISRAYLTTSRVLHGMGVYTDTQKIVIKNRAAAIILHFVNNISFREMEEAEFDNAHAEVCGLLLEYYGQLNPAVHFTIGTAQKWINMTLKHMIMFHLIEINEWRATLQFLNNYKHFHIPIDSYIKDNENIRGIYLEKFDDIAWSNIDDYAAYIELQNQLRTEYGPLLDFEFDVWMKA